MASDCRPPPKRVAGGIVLRAKKKTKTTSKATPTASALVHPARNDDDGERISSVRRRQWSMSSSSSSRRRGDEIHDEFDDDPAAAPFEDLPSDALMCLRAYTSPPTAVAGGGGLGAMSETCAYCPIFSPAAADAAAVRGAAPFMTRGTLLHALVGSVSSTYSYSSSSRHGRCAHAEREVRGLLGSGAVRPLRLHGLTVGCGDEDDDEDGEDVAIMETSVYVVASGIALGSGGADRSSSSSSSSTNSTNSTATTTRAAPREEVHAWFVNVLLPRFAGRTWAPSLELDELRDGWDHDVRGGDVREMEDEVRASETTSNAADCRNRRRYSSDRTRDMILQLTHAGLLLPKRHVGPGGGDDDGGRRGGYWFSLPGLGRAARSIELGRADVLRRLRCRPNGERGRMELERAVERSIAGRRAWRDAGEGEGDGRDGDGFVASVATATTNGRTREGSKGMRYAQSGKFVVMDLLAKGWIRINETCTGEQFIRLAE
ncbi:hypothetical protein ACHAW5_003807 [Stephanodiscus triporus]|uniref:Uncharacterized protein n=1 Tax=Stephanodiscus triporus TaxID=2934178 RepID=A0ABD3MTV5_9STRA